MNSMDSINDNGASDSPKVLMHSSGIAQWKVCVQQLRFLKKKKEQIIPMIVKHFKDVDPVAIDLFIDTEPMPTAFLTSKSSTVTSEDILSCLIAILVEMNDVSISRGIFLGAYLQLISECKKHPELKDIHKDHLAIFKSLNI